MQHKGHAVSRVMYEGKPTRPVQVVHHPTIVAMHGEGESWSFEADADVRAKFWGRSVELVPVGLIRLKFDDEDEYNWTKVRLAALSYAPCVRLPQTLGSVLHRKLCP